MDKKNLIFSLKKSTWQDDKPEVLLGHSTLRSISSYHKQISLSKFSPFHFSKFQNQWDLINKRVATFGLSF